MTQGNAGWQTGGAWDGKGARGKRRKKKKWHLKREVGGKATANEMR